MCFLAALTTEGVQAAGALGLVGYGGSNRDMVDKLTFRVYSLIFSGTNQVLPSPSQCEVSWDGLSCPYSSFNASRLICGGAEEEDLYGLCC